jgi:hypothetical protein
VVAGGEETTAGVSMQSSRTRSANRRRQSWANGVRELIVALLQTARLGKSGRMVQSKRDHC